jgi:putative endonuclease
VKASTKIHKESWEIYIIETETGRLYTGIAKSSVKRFDEHLHNKRKGAKFFRTDRPLRIVYIELQTTRSAALKREWEIKNLPREKKLALFAVNSKKSAP